MICDNDYKETIQVLKNQKSITPIFQELKTFIEQTFFVKVANLLFDNDMPEGRYRLGVLLTSKKDKEKFMKKEPCVYGYSTEMQNIIAEKICEIAPKYSFFNAEKLKNVFVYFMDFSHEIKVDIVDKCYKEAIGFVKKNIRT
jgi:hypothetical protein